MIVLAILAGFLLGVSVDRLGILLWDWLNERAKRRHRADDLARLVGDCCEEENHD